MDLLWDKITEWLKDVLISGIVSGEIHGTVTGVMHATVDGDVSLTLLSGSAEEGGDAQ